MPPLALAGAPSCPGSAERIEYGAEVELERLTFNHARWVEGPATPDEIRRARIAMGVWDQDKRPVALMRDDWELRRAAQDNPKWTFHRTAPIAGATA